MEMTVSQFLEALSGKAAVPGGGSVAALCGSLSAALGSMAANLTSGKKKYAQYQEDIERLLAESQRLCREFEELMEQDAAAFLPLSKAYGIPKTDPGRPAIMEEALRTASAAPAAVIETSAQLLAILEELVGKCSVLVVSDVGVAAACCRCAAESALLNVCINTKMMADRAYAGALEEKAVAGTQDTAQRSQRIYAAVLASLRK